MVKLFGNGRVRNFEIDNPASDPNLVASIAIAFLRLGYALPFAIVGIGLVGAQLVFFKLICLYPQKVFVYWYFG